MRGEGEFVAVLDDSAGFWVGFYHKLGHNAETCTGAAQCPEQTRILGIAGPLDRTVGSDHFDFEDMIERASPLARNWSKTALLSVRRVDKGPIDIPLSNALQCLLLGMFRGRLLVSHLRADAHPIRLDSCLHQM